LPLVGDRMISNMNESVFILQSKSNQKQQRRVLDAKQMTNPSKRNKM